MSASSSSREEAFGLGGLAYPGLGSLPGISPDLETDGHRPVGGHFGQRVFSSADLVVFSELDMGVAVEMLVRV